MRKIKTIPHKEWIGPHCATVCPHRDGVLLAYYRGPECSNHQAVVIEYWDKWTRYDEITHSKKHTLMLPPKTGNCVLIPLEENRALLIFSRFEDINEQGEKPQTGVQRWRFCSNWQMTLETVKDGFRMVDLCRFPTPASIGYLTRCAPIQKDQRWYLPIYQEHDCQGAIMSFKPSNVESGPIQWQIEGYIGRGQNKLIQPTIWHDGETFYSLSRDVTHQNRAWYSVSHNNCKTWTDPIQAEITNYNNSVVAIQDGTEGPLIVWNNGPHRQSLELGYWDDKRKDVETILKLNDGPVRGPANASYPNYCFDKEGLLHIVHTERGKGIVRHIIEV